MVESAYAMSGTEMAFGGTGLHACGTRCLVLTYPIVVSAYALATRCPGLSWRIRLGPLQREQSGGRRRGVHLPRLR
eukprot:1785612-Rhodomonas_salina.3